jgi:hypothetical protein
LAAQQEINEALGAAEEARVGLIGDQGATEFIEVATTDRVVSSGISYNDMGRGYGQLAASASDSGITSIDQHLALVFQKQRIKFQTHAALVANNYTEASFLKDWTRLFDTSGNFLVARQVHIDLQSGGNEGIIGNIHSAAVLKNRGQTIEYIDPDQVGTAYKQVDILTSDLMIQTGLTSNTIKGKIGLTVDDAVAMAKVIKEMETAHPGKLYKFSYMEGEPEDFNSVIGYLNEALQYPEVAHSRVFTAADFIKTPWNE